MTFWVVSFSLNAPTCPNGKIDDKEKDKTKNRKTIVNKRNCMMQWAARMRIVSICLFEFRFSSSPAAAASSSRSRVSCVTRQKPFGPPGVVMGNKKKSFKWYKLGTLD
jgi:hypothetical protein